MSCTFTTLIQKKLNPRNKSSKAKIFMVLPSLKILLKFQVEQSFGAEKSSLWSLSVSMVQ